MFSSSDDGSHMTDESSARRHWGRRIVSLGFLRIVQQTKAQGNPPVVSDAANLRIPSNRLLKLNERYASISPEDVGRLSLNCNPRDILQHLGRRWAELSFVRTENHSYKGLKLAII
ncbi:unnamed protein product [Protopolystoma xenopodis]|uniref:Uncharacterized protein n=1 Tax=Protopolystoma xenopodis TaxID=117903 RepID=A0A448WHA2_9PLAT|nr:unnamed protein product [Protopolystoma xenopodis]